MARSPSTQKARSTSQQGQSSLRVAVISFIIIIVSVIMIGTIITSIIIFNRFAHSFGDLEAIRPPTPDMKMLLEIFGSSIEDSLVIHWDSLSPTSTHMNPFPKAVGAARGQPSVLLLLLL